ncbi:HAD family hydrolase [Paenibacillus polysaccharolyticus]|uniref:HAD family hydrolase n=1 Tax=Paenibacillus polysaccharolyticus TaxID=582692 RepID=UPI0029597E8A|nr:putative hydrolase of the HAD superfamily [Paenibacillus intestini]
MVQKLKAIIFDFDGLIVDTETPWYYAFRDIYEEHGVELGLELWSKNVGTSFEEFHPYRYLEQMLQKEINHEQIRLLSEQKYESYLGQASMLPGVLELLDAAREKGIRLAVASSSTRDWVHGYLQKLGLFDYFEVIHTSDDVKRVKPDPELYLLTLQKLGVEADEAIVFEDSPNGLKAANAAGIRCYIVPNEVTRGLEFTMHERRLSSLAEMKI